MQPQFKMPKAFTLIELLIVVAIIAILAAIAVPNFLEAQTRSKVSRVKNDMRVVGMAIRQYEIDNNDPPVPRGKNNAALYSSDFLNYSIWVQNADPAKSGGQGKRLTSPIAYITSIPQDPFVSLKAWNDPQWVWISFGYTYYGKNGQEVLPLSHLEQRYGKRARYGWKLQCGGPDLFYNWGPNQKDTTGYLPQKGGLDGIYDPTNGTISAGDMYFIDRWGLIGGGGGT